MTHAVNLKKIHDSLHVSCFFIDELSLSEATEQQQLPAIENEIKAQLSAINIKSPTISF
ncbi:hypothetical protein PPRY_b1022 [Pseudoalteromonas prydzensis ACAM 620]|nr:hypothetical protein [Pseudoalteromonas prydzensis ACAM 620]